MSAEMEFKQLIDRILRCREAEDEAKADTKEVYAELKARGYDKTAAGALVAELRKKDKDPAQFEERNATLDLYRDVYERASHAHTREGREASTQGSAAVEARAAHNREVAGSTPAPATNSVSVQSQDAAAVYPKVPA